MIVWKVTVYCAQFNNRGRIYFYYALIHYQFSIKIFFCDPSTVICHLFCIFTNSIRNLMKQIVHVLFLLSLTVGLQRAFAQSNPYPYPVAQDRMLFHDDIDKEQKHLLALDGNADDKFTLSKDESINKQVYDALITRVNEIQKQIELDTTLNTNFKKRYLIGLKYLLIRFMENYSKPEFTLSIAPALITGFEKAMQFDKKNESIEPIIAENNYGVGKILNDCFLYPSENVGVKPSKIILFRKYCGLHPNEIFSLLRNNLDVPFADSLIMVAGHNNIRQLYDYAASNSALGWRIKNNYDPLVHIVSQMANSKSGQLFFPFLDNLMKGKITIDDINRVKDDDLNYYRFTCENAHGLCFKIIATSAGYGT